jgi:hypothetical protein
MRGPADGPDGLSEGGTSLGSEPLHLNIESPRKSRGFMGPNAKSGFITQAKVIKAILECIEKKQRPP